MKQRNYPLMTAERFSVLRPVSLDQATTNRVKLTYSKIVDLPNYKITFCRAKHNIIMSVWTKCSYDRDVTEMNDPVHFFIPIKQAKQFFDHCERMTVKHHRIEYSTE